MRLTKHFALSEFEESAKAKQLGIDNTCPDFQVAANLKDLAGDVLQPIREHFGKPVRINSGFRCAALNSALPGSSRISQHQTGHAADIEIAGLSNLELAEWIEANLGFDQLILENHTAGDPNSGWVHVSFDSRKNRMEVKTAVFESGKKPVYLPGLQV